MRAAGVFAVTGDDSHNLVVSLPVKQINPKARVVAREGLLNSTFLYNSTRFNENPG